MNKKIKNPPFSIEVKILDEKGKRVFHFRHGRSNLKIGLEKTNEYVEKKLGIDSDEKEDKQIGKIMEAFEVKKNDKRLDKKE